MTTSEERNKDITLYFTEEEIRHLCRIANHEADMTETPFMDINLLHKIVDCAYSRPNEFPIAIDNVKGE